MSSFETSIILPVFNHWERTRNCLKSIAANTDREKIELIVVDNASADVTPKAYQFLGQQLFGNAFRYIRNEENRNFAGAANQGARQASGEYVIFLHNDTEVLPGWYQPLLDDFTQYNDIAASGPLLVSPLAEPFGRTVQELGTVISPFRSIVHLYQGIPADSSLARKRRFFQAISAACMVMRRRLFLEAGQFDEDFVNGLEDVDLCARLTHMGYRMTINPSSRVAHLQSPPTDHPGNNADNLRHLQRKSLHFVQPDWHSHLNNDGMRLVFTPWLTLTPAMPAERAAELDRVADAADFEQLRAMLLDAPFWEHGWQALIGRCQEPQPGRNLRHSYFTLFKKPASLAAACRMAHAAKDEPLFTRAFAELARFCTNPSTFDAARGALQACTSEGLTDLADQATKIIRDAAQFEKQYLQPLAEEAYTLGCMGYVLFSLDEPVEYAVWHHAVAQPAQRRTATAFLRQYAENTADLPKFSLLAPLSEAVRGEYLRAALQSVLNQSYPCWELCIAIPDAADQAIKRIVTEYADRDPRIRVVQAPDDRDMAKTANAALAMAAHPWIAVLGQEDMLAPDALALVAKAIHDHPEAAFLFSDEDKIRDTAFVSPYFKSDNVDPELLPTQNYCKLAVYGIEDLRQLAGFREGLADAWEYDMFLRYLSQGKNGAIHIPSVLYHRRETEGDAHGDADARRKVVQDWLDKCAPGACVDIHPYARGFRVRYPLPPAENSVSLICAVHDAGFSVNAFMKAWHKQARWIQDIIFVCHDPFQKELERQLEGFQTIAKTYILSIPNPVPLPKALNIASRKAQGRILGFLEADILPTNEHCLEELVSCLGQADVGTAGGRIVHSSRQLEHGGYLCDGSEVLKKILVRAPADRPWFFGWNMLARTVDALDNLCLFTKAETFAAAHGFTAFTEGWFAQDYCLRLGQQGLRSLWWPFAEFTSRESASKESTDAEMEQIKTVPKTITRLWRGMLKPHNRNIIATGGPSWILNGVDFENDEFSGRDYWQLYRSVKYAGINPLMHYLYCGKKQMRKARISRINYDSLTPERIAQWKAAPKNGIIVCTSLCGGYERLLPPAHLVDGWQYVCFSDSPVESWGIWDIRPIPVDQEDLTRKSRWAKLHLPHLFPDAKWIFWQDANIVINSDLSELLENRDPETFLFSVLHPTRTCVYDETMACIAFKKDSPEVLATQAAVYRKAGLPRNFGLYENNFFLVNPRHPYAKDFFTQWWQEYTRFSRRDQISLPYVIYTTGYRPGLLLPEGSSARNWPALHCLYHDETLWTNSPNR